MKEDYPSLGEYAYEMLRANIREGALPPGARVREAEVAGRLEISRTPVREALRRLEADGHVARAADSWPDHQLDRVSGDAGETEQKMHKATKTDRRIFNTCFSEYNLKSG